jgi:GNAT-family acetyltransferase (TIGR03103 family)
VSRGSPRPPRQARPSGYDRINPHTRVIVDESLRRGIAVEIVDPERGELQLTCGARIVTTFESLSELTSAVAFRRCDDKVVTRSVLERAGLPIPAGRAAAFDGADVDFLHEYGSIVVKPARGEQGWGVTVAISTVEDLRQACTTAQRFWPTVLLEEHRVGADVRIVVIAGTVVAAAVRRPATVTGDGRSTVAQLIEAADRRRRAETDGSARIPLDAGVARMVASAGWRLDSVLPTGCIIVVSPTANVHNGATIEDVTGDLHPALADLAVRAADAIALPVAGIDLIVDAPDKPDGTIIEVNEQPGLANHEPNPTAARFVDLLFPETLSSRGKQVLGQEGRDDVVG